MNRQPTVLSQPIFALAHMVQRITISMQQCQGSSLRLEKDQSHYLRRVLRLASGDRFIAQDGQGHQWLAALTDSPDQANLLESIESAPHKTTPIRLIAALPKGNGFDQVVRQSTELGVTHIYPVLSDRTLLKPSSNKLSRWQRIAQEASEQSERQTVPVFSDPMDFRVCLKHLCGEGENNNRKKVQDDFRYICVARNLGNTPHLLTQLMNQRTRQLAPADLPGVVLAIGPEGGWTSDEITDAISYGYKAVTLGSVILRSVTAPITALSLVIAARETLI